MLKRVLEKLILTFCRLGFAGLMPKAPGTWGSALACVIAPFCFVPLNDCVRFFLLIILFIVGGIASSFAEKILRKKDPSEVVIDELVGVWIVLLPYKTPSLLVYLLAFIFFRLFDILKPWPVRASENWLPNGFGIMIDDVIAGIFALICTYSVYYFIL